MANTSRSATETQSVPRNANPRKDNDNMTTTIIERRDVLDCAFVELLNHDFDDNAVRDAARISHDACAKSAKPTLIKYLAKNHHFTPFGHVRYFGDFPIIDDDKWIDWLASKKPGWNVRRIDNGSGQRVYRIEGSLYNWLGMPSDLPPLIRREREGVYASLIANGCGDTVRSFLDDATYAQVASTQPLYPIERSEDYITFRVFAPKFVLAQMMRSNHEIVYNEISRRYVKSYPKFHSPDVWRSAPEGNIKQGSGSDEIRTFSTEAINEWIEERGAFPFAVDIKTAYADWIQTAGELYSLLIDSNVAPEQARMVCPFSFYSEVWMTLSLDALRRITGLRSNRGDKNHAQKEIEAFSRAMEQIMFTEFKDEGIGDAE